MKNRLIDLPFNFSFFLFGARNTGKSTLIHHLFHNKSSFYIDLLDLNQEQKYLQDPQLLKFEVLGLPESITHVIIDEIQKIPPLLDVIHSLIETTNKCFILTGSSARKLKYGHANLLAGRALVKELFPFSYLELGDDFNLQDALRFGMLPKIYDVQQEEIKADILRAYTHTYLKEEVWAEHLIRKLSPFQYFLEVAAQANGTIINTANIARDVGVDDKSIVQYFSILEDTLIGFYLPAFHHSFRKRLHQKPKFYFFDLGVVRALTKTLTLPVLPGTYEYGKLFEHFVILECHKLIRYFLPDYRISYLRTHDDLEIDLVVERPGLPLLLIEIKSGEEYNSTQLSHLRKLANSLGNQAEYACFSQVKQALKFDEIIVYPWMEGIQKYFYKSK